MKITTRLQLLVAGLIAGLIAASAMAIWEAIATRGANENAYRSETVATAT